MSTESQPGDAQHPNQTPPPDDARPSNTRWIVAAAAAVGVAVLAMMGVMGPSKEVVVEDPPTMAADGRGTPACKADKTANLDFTLRDMNGASVKLSDYKGKVILVNFWATWCAPCKAELPAFVELYDRYKDKGLVILGISGDDDPETLKAFASEWKLNYPVLVGRDETDLLDAYGPIFGYPISVLVGRDGAVCGRHIGPATKEEFEREIKALL